MKPSLPHQPSRSPSYSPASRQPIERSTFLTLLRTGIETGETRFARRAALAWLASYPGDLMVNLLHARALVQEGHPKQALPILEAIWQADPEFIEAQDLLAKTRRAAGDQTSQEASARVFALGGRPAAKGAIPEWSLLLRQSRQSLSRKDFEKAGQYVHQALVSDTQNILTAITHLHVDVGRSLPPESIRNLAELYHQRWPSCLQFMLILAEALMDGGETDRAVSLLHQAVAHDVAGQVAERLWGEDHPYSNLWPDRLEMVMELAIPAAIGSLMGWNRLPDKIEARTTGQVKAEETQRAEIPLRDREKRRVYISMHPAPKWVEAQSEKDSQPAVDRNTGTGVARKKAITSKAYTIPETLLSVHGELEKVADHVRKPQLSKLDGRFPIYVIFTTRKGLTGQFGPEAAAKLDEEMKRLVEAVRRRKDWGAMLYYADEADSVNGPKSLGLEPAKLSDPWELKLALVDLDAALSRRGEMIGAVLIVGGPEVVPFHHLPNPVDDVDADVPSDNPYATRDENYFIPEWPVGRLPGGAGVDPGPLMHSLSKLTERHVSRQPQPAWYRRVWSSILRKLWPWNSRERASLGYTAAIWRKASMSVYRPIGEPRSLLVSPPTHVNAPPEGSGGLWRRRPFTLPIARLGYFNLHGLQDAVEWYGQSEPGEHVDGTDYPIALRPQDVVNSGRAPEVVYSEACYGAHILGRTVEEAMALKFLVSGTQAVVGSTCISYGSIATPLISADLLGYAFWNYLGEGLPAGEALRRAKINLAREMHRRQGYLDGEDQKTLISFVLYGDPLAQPVKTGSRQKTALRMLRTPTQVKTVCDRGEGDSPPKPVQPEILAQVKHIVSQYLPGMTDAELCMAQEHTECKGHECPTAQLGAKIQPGQNPTRRVIVLSKQVQNSTSLHRHYARLTLDAQGKLVKLVVSR